MSASHLHTNRLARETSPYLLQHAHNPVDWYPWGPEAFAAARQQNKPIFLSVGYSTCYWCHVMERQCFEDESIAQLMNELFVNIKVDREERPDVDQLYMTALQILSRSAGWPMSLFLTPDLRPFWGGTYFPPTDQYGRPGFPTVLRSISEAWSNRRQEVEQAGEELVNVLKQLAAPTAIQAPVTINEAWVERQVSESIHDYDATHGGFGSAPKFPRETLLELLLVYVSSQGGNPSTQEAQEDQRKVRILEMLRHTLDAMALGGIRDHLGGAFHRYSTDAGWLVPHFEIMLYDNAMLAWIYVEAYRQTEQRRYAEVARGILDFVLAEMTAPQGAFYTAFDAETNAQEGATYLWTPAEIGAILGPDDAEIFSHVYGLDLGPNFADPHGQSETPDKNILYMPHALEVSADDLRLDPQDLSERLVAMRHKLNAARRQRPQPMLDRKILTSWNALMIRALAHAGDILQEQRYLDAAARAADYLLRHHRTAAGTLLRTTRPDSPAALAPAPGTEVFVATPTDEPSVATALEPPLSEQKNQPAPAVASPESPPAPAIPGFLDDYAFLIQALIELREAGGREPWKDHAAALAIALLDRFADDAAGGFFYTDRESGDLLVRQKVGSDSPLPSGNAVAALAMLALGQPRRARATLAAFAAQMNQHGESMSALLQATLAFVRRHGAFTVHPPAATPAHASAATAADATMPDRPLSPQQLAEGVVALSAHWVEPTRLNVVADILPPFHLNAHEAAPGLIPTQLTVTSDGEPPQIDYPPGELTHLAFSDQPLRLYTGRITFSLRFAHPRAGQRPLTIHLAYQACTDDACLPPATRRLELRTPDST